MPYRGGGWGIGPVLGLGGPVQLAFHRRTGVLHGFVGLLHGGLEAEPLLGVVPEGTE